MSNFIRHNAIAIAALFIALGGTATAASTLARNSVTSTTIKDRSVQTRDLAPSARGANTAKVRAIVADTMTSSDVLTALSTAVEGDAGPAGAPGAKGDTGGKGDKGDKGDRGDTGTRGDQGTPGPAGTSVGSGNVAANGDAELAYLTTTQHATEGAYCFDTDKGVIPHVRAATATVAGPSSATATVRLHPSGGACDGHDLEVQTAVNGTSTDAAFYLIVA